MSRELRYLRKQRKKLRSRLTKDSVAHKEVGEITRQEQLFGLKVSSRFIIIVCAGDRRLNHLCKVTLSDYATPTLLKIYWEGRPRNVSLDTEDVMY